MIPAPIPLPYHLRHLSIHNAPPPQQHADSHPSGKKKKIKFVNPNIDNYDRNIRNAARLQKEKGYRNIRSGELNGRTAIVAGSGNSLRDPKVITKLRKLVKKKKAVVFACKQAIKILYDLGIHVDYGVTMDPGGHIARPEKIYKAPGTKHIVASSSDPLLFDYLSSGKKFPEWVAGLSEQEKSCLYKKSFHEFMTKMDYSKLKEELSPEILIFHSATGYHKDNDTKNEVYLYESLFEDGHVMGGGYNVVNRALAAAMFMGCKEIYLAGNDSGWRDGESFYADGTRNREGIDMNDNGRIDGRTWHTRPDMLASALAMAKLPRIKDKCIKEIENFDKQLESYNAALIAETDCTSGKPVLSDKANRILDSITKMQKFRDQKAAYLENMATIHFLGDTMPAALQNHTDEFLAKIGESL